MSIVASPPRFAAVIFDMDGTLLKPVLDFGRIREETGILKGDMVEEIRRLPPPRQAAVWAIIERHEEAALRTQQLQDGCLELLNRCRAAGVRIGVVTRNARRSVDHFCRAYGVRFDGVVSREFAFVKPHPAPVRKLLGDWRVPPAEALMVGDYIHDIESGRAAGTRTCFFHNPGATFHGQSADFTVGSMGQLEQVVFGA